MGVAHSALASHPGPMVVNGVAASTEPFIALPIPIGSRLKKARAGRAARARGRGAASTNEEREGVPEGTPDAGGTHPLRK